LMRPVWERTNGVDGYVSWEVDPTLAYDVENTYEEAQRLHEWIGRPNLHVKIPATKPGVAAIEDMIASGKNINVTLIFSLQRYKAAVPVGVHVDEEPGVPRRDVRRGADRAGDREHDARGDDSGVPGPRGGRGHAREGDQEGAQAARGARGGRRRLRRRRADAR